MKLPKENINQFSFRIWWHLFTNDKNSKSASFPFLFLKELEEEFKYSEVNEANTGILVQLSIDDNSKMFEIDKSSIIYHQELSGEKNEINEFILRVNSFRELAIKLQSDLGVKHDHYHQNFIVFRFINEDNELFNKKLTDITSNIVNDSKNIRSRNFIVEFSENVDDDKIKGVVHRMAYDRFNSQMGLLYESNFESHIQKDPQDMEKWIPYITQNYLENGSDIN